MTTPDWQLPPGVDRGLWDYMNSGEMAAGYEEQMRASPLAEADVAFCERVFPTPGRLLDLGCGTGRLCRHFAARGFACLGIDLSSEMLEQARACTLPAVPGSLRYTEANLVELTGLDDCSFDFAACLFSTLGMLRGAEHRAAAIAEAFRVLAPGGRFVLHVHNRYFAGLGKKWGASDITMPQAYAGAPLTLHHFARSEAVSLLTRAGFVVRLVQGLGIDGRPARWPTALRAYGYLLLGERRA